MHNSCGVGLGGLLTSIIEHTPFGIFVFQKDPSSIWKWTNVQHFNHLQDKNFLFFLWKSWKILKIYFEFKFPSYPSSFPLLLCLRKDIITAIMWVQRFQCRAITEIWGFEGNHSRLRGKWKAKCMLGMAIISQNITIIDDGQ